MPSNMQLQRTAQTASGRTACVSFIVHTRRAPTVSAPPLNRSVSHHRTVAASIVIL